MNGPLFNHLTLAQAHLRAVATMVPDEAQEDFLSAVSAVARVRGRLGFPQDVPDELLSLAASLGHNPALTRSSRHAESHGRAGLQVVSAGVQRRGRSTNRKSAIRNRQSQTGGAA